VLACLARRRATYLGRRLGPAGLDVLLTERQDLEQGRRALGLFVGRDVLQHGPGLAVLGYDQGLAPFGKLGEHLGGIGLEVADGFDAR